MGEYTVGRTGVFVAERAMPAYSNPLEACMANFDNLKKQAKLLVRWHRAGNYSVGGRIRSLPRYRNLTDVEALALKRSEEHTSELQSHLNLVCRLLLEKKKNKAQRHKYSDQQCSR